MDRDRGNRDRGNSSDKDRETVGVKIGNADGLEIGNYFGQRQRKLLAQS